jgi:DNA-binding response OmpR family regulator
MDQPCLIDQSGQRHAIAGAAFVIGRGESADLMIDLPQISRRHALIELRADLRYVIDQDSRNGTFVNGVRAGVDPVRLADGDELTFASAATYVYRDPTQTANGAGGVTGIGRLHGVWIDAAHQEVWVNAVRVTPPVSRQQYVLLKTLYDAPGRIFTREELADILWPAADRAALDASLVAVDGLVKRTQSRLRAYHQDDSPVQFVRGRGVRIVLPDAE